MISDYAKMLEGDIVDSHTSANPCGEIPLGDPQYTVLKERESQWPCIIEAGDIPDPMTLDTANRMAQAEADDEGVPVRFCYQGAGFIAYPNAGIKADPAIPMFHQTAVTFTGGQRGGKTSRMKADMEKTLMEILAKDGGDHE